MTAPDACPVCGQARSLNKVSAVYIAGIQARKRSADQLPVKVRGIPDEALPELSRRLAPPASRKEMQVRLVHPDIVVLVFSAIFPVFLAGIYAQQQVFFYPMLIGLAAAYAVYLWQRKNILKRFARQVQAEQAKKERIQRGIRRWMNLYYCAEDDMIFEPGGAPPVPADQINGYLFQNLSEQ